MEEGTYKGKNAAWVVGALQILAQSFSGRFFWFSFYREGN